tara:strand:- start:36 stop:539 length:504 start_codon:yes stop_codon:yes gene_type:complete
MNRLLATIATIATIVLSASAMGALNDTWNYKHHTDELTGDIHSGAFLIISNPDYNANGKRVSFEVVCSNNTELYSLVTFGRFINLAGHNTTVLYRFNGEDLVTEEWYAIHGGNGVYNINPSKEFLDNLVSKNKLIMRVSSSTETFTQRIHLDAAAGPIQKVINECKQ